MSKKKYQQVSRSMCKVATDFIAIAAAVELHTGRTVSMQQLSVLFDVLLNGDGVVGNQYVMRKYGLSMSTASRVCRSLTDWSEPNTRGFNYCVWQVSTVDRRLKALCFTAEGVELMRVIADALNIELVT